MLHDLTYKLGVWLKQFCGTIKEYFGLEEMGYYTHLKQLVFAMHIGENRQISQDKLDEMHVLLQYHVNQFKILYGTRHMVNNIHSLIHLAETVRDYTVKKKGRIINPFIYPSEHCKKKRVNNFSEKRFQK